MKSCESFAPNECITSCPNAEYDYYYQHPDLGPQYNREMGYKRITCRKCGAYDNPDCDRCMFYGSSEMCQNYQETIVEAVKEVRQ